MRRIRAVSPVLVATPLWLVGCATELPSSVPLGSGPLAGEPAVTSGAPRADLGAAVQRGDSDDESSDEGASSANEAADATAPSAPETKPKTADTKPADAGVTPQTQPARSEVAGRYAGTDFTLLHFSNGNPDFRAEDPNAKTDVAETKDGIDVTVLDSGRLVPMCTLHAKLDGNRSHATIDAGQSCDLGMVVTTTTSGSVDFKDKHLHFELKVDFDANTEQGRLSGDGEYRFDGDRQ